MEVNTQLNTGTVPLPIFKNTVNISSDQVLAMYASPVLLIPAQGDHKFIFVHDLFIEYIFNTTGYSDGSGISLQYGNAGSDTSTTIFMSSNISIVGATSNFGGDPITPFSTFSALSDWVNQGVYAGTTVDSFTTGDGTLRIEVFYTVVTTAA